MFTPLAVIVWMTIKYIVLFNVIVDEVLSAGKSGLRVSEICLKAMTFGKDWGWGASKEESQVSMNI